MSLAKPTEVKDVSDVELPCFSSATCYVHARIPPCDTLGHKADCWNVSKPDFVCALQALTRGDLFIVRLLTEDQQIFAESFWKPEKPMSSIIDAAMDSSRYFALRVENPETGSHVFIGIGFAERETAGQFKLTLAEHGRYLQRMQKAERDQLASPSATGNPPAGVATDASGSLLQTDSPMSSRLSTDSGRSGSPTAMRDMALHGSVRVELPNMGEKRGLMAKGRGTPAGGSSALPLLLRGNSGSGRGLLPPPPGRVLCRDVSGSHRWDEDDVARGFSAPGSARSASSVDMDSTPTAPGKQGVATRATMASPQIAAGSTGGTVTSSGVMETNTSMVSSVAASAGDTTAADEEFGDFIEAQE